MPGFLGTFEAPAQDAVDLRVLVFFELLWHSTDMEDCGHDRVGFALMIFTELCKTSLQGFMESTKNGVINTHDGKALIVRFLFEITDALAFMHGREMIHHDIKPDNILISDDDHVRITDFGVSAHINECPLKGDWTFLPPEVILGVASYDTAVAGLRPSKKDAFATGITAYMMLRDVGGVGSTTYHNDTWFSIIHADDDREMTDVWRAITEGPNTELCKGRSYVMGQIYEEEKDRLLARELSHLPEHCEAVRFVKGMLEMDLEHRSSIQDGREQLLRFWRNPNDFFSPSAAANAGDISEGNFEVPEPPTVPPARIDFQPRHWLLSVCVWSLRLTPLSALSALVVWRFVVESDDDDVQKGQNELQRMVAATTAALVFSSCAASIVSAGLVRMKQTLVLRYILIILVMIGTFGLGTFLLNLDVGIGAIFILYSISQLFTIWSVYTDSLFGGLQDCSNKQLEYCNTKLLANLTRFEPFGLQAATLVFQLGILYAGITVVRQLPTDLWELIFLVAVCWFVNLPRYLAHFWLVRAMTNAVNLCQQVSYIEMMQQVLENVNSILAWSLLAVQQPLWSALEMMAITLQRAGLVLIGCGICTSTDNDRRSDRRSNDRHSNNFCSCVCLCVGVAVVRAASALWWLSSKLSIYCSKFYISILAYDVALGGDDNSCRSVVNRLQNYGVELNRSVKSMLFFSNKSISSSNNANVCILLGCVSALIAAAIDEQAGLYGYIAGYLACSTVLEVQSSMFQWFLAVYVSQDDDACPEVRDTRPTCKCLCAGRLILTNFSFLLQVMNTIRESLSQIDEDFRHLEQGLNQPNNDVPPTNQNDGASAANNNAAEDPQIIPPENAQSMSHAGAQVGT